MENQATNGEGLSLSSLLCLGSKPALPRAFSHLESNLPIALLLVFAALQSAKGVFLLCVGLQDWGIQYVTQTTHSPGPILQYIFPFPLSSLPGAQISTSLLQFPSFPVLCGSLLQPWWYRSLSASFQLLFSENCSISRCIFDTSMERGEFHILLYYTILIQSPISFLNVCLWERFEN